MVYTYRLLDIRSGAAPEWPARSPFPSYRRQSLDAVSGDLLWIPPGFAHGYQVLSDAADVVYKLTAEYRPELGRGVRWNDPAIGIAWPLEDPVLSDADRVHPMLADAADPFGAGGAV